MKESIGKILIFGSAVIVAGLLFVDVHQDTLTSDSANNLDSVFPGGSPLEKTIIIGTTIIKVEVEDTPIMREQGLSGREKLVQDQGMLFVFDYADRYQFWMKEMKFSIDIIWVGDDLKVVDISENLSPDTYPKIFEPKNKARYVVEVDAGFAKEKGIKIGDTIQL
jgi:uncharacterized membrane protein (UPF0127 family)